MSFFFKSKKSLTPSTLPPATRNIHTSDGTPTATTNNEHTAPERLTQSPPPQVNASSGTNPNALTNAINLAPSNMAKPPTTFVPSRNRSESEAGARPTNLMAQVPNAALYPWSQRRLNFPTPQSNPFPRYGAAVNAVASKDGDVYMMGGLINGSMVRGDLWMVDSGGGNLSCYPIATVSEGPGPRVGHASLLVGNAFIVFGGDTKMDDSDVLDDTLYLLNTSSRQWSRATPPGQRPAGRYGHTLNIIGSKIYVFGGQVEGYFFNDLVAFDLNALQSPSNQWEVLIRNAADDEKHTSPVPPARTNHSIVSFNDKLYLFGGTNGTTWFNDVWMYDPNTNSWAQQDCIGYIPAPREGHSAALVNDVMYIFGGRTEEGTDLGDLAAFRITSKRWYTFQNMGPSPSPRSGHSMTAHGKQVIVLGGEPSSAPRDPGELSMVYVLDTAKIRYPNDAPANTTATQSSEAKQPTSPTRRPSTDARSGSSNAKRSLSREGQYLPTETVSRNTSSAKDGSSNPHPPRSDSGRSNPNSADPRIPRAAGAAVAAAPPNTTIQPQPLASRANGATSPTSGIKSQQAPVQAPIPVDNRNGPIQAPAVQPPTIREVHKDISRTSRDGSPNNHGRRTPTQPVSKVKAMEANEAAPLVHSSVARQRSNRSHRGQGSIDSSDPSHRLSDRHHSDGQGSLRSFADEPRSPKISAHQEALMKELEASKRTNAWYASELALARKAGYPAANSSSPTFDERAINQVSDDDRPLIEAFMTMRSEMVKMQQTMESQSSSTAKRIAEVEHQRDAAVAEAAYARAKLAAHGGSQRSTPQPDLMREHDDAERSTDISRRLALALSASNDYKAKIETLNTELNTERKAREAAEEAAEAVQRRLEELDQGRNPAEVEGLRAELHQAQGTARAEATQRSEAEEQLRMLRVDHESVTAQHSDVSTRLKEQLSTMAALQAAMHASSGKSNLFERQLDEERQRREEIERKLTQLKSQHEERTSELESTSKRLRDAEELAETHAKEATTHREALVVGLSKLTNNEASSTRGPVPEQRIMALQESTERANALAKQHQLAAEAAAQKLRAAEERIAGLEAYQEQSSREGLQIRRQLQAALRDTQSHQGEVRELRGRLDKHQRDAGALAVQHSALKDLLGERGMSMSDARRSPNFDNSPSSRYGTPELGRVRELEHQLQHSMKSHEETKSHYESRMQEADGTYREKLEQLENDYQSAVHYVKGTEKMLKKMKEELTKYKGQNAALQSEIESTRSASVLSGGGSEAATWSAERESLQMSIDDIKRQMSGQISVMEANLASVQQDLAAVRAERDQQRSAHSELTQSVKRGEAELEELKTENSMLQHRAEEAEKRVTMLLDQVGSTVGNYRRQSQLHATAPVMPNGIGHNREASASTITDTSSQDDDFSREERGSVALDNLASELETLRSQWESTSRANYRLSNQFDFERTPTRDNSNVELSDSLANWRRRLDEEERQAHPPAQGSSKQSTAV